MAGSHRLSPPRAGLPAVSAAVLSLLALARVSAGEAAAPGSLEKKREEASYVRMAALTVVPTQAGAGEVSAEAANAATIPSCSKFDDCLAGGERVSACCTSHLAGDLPGCGICLKSGCVLRSAFCKLPTPAGDASPDAYCEICYKVGRVEEGEKRRARSEAAKPFGGKPFGKNGKPFNKGDPGRKPGGDWPPPKKPGFQPGRKSPAKVPPKQRHKPGPPPFMKMEI
mmetsp:Transcript_42042/g.121937  ORF Transcript_42042/g.121937 Transcript_42042/m.121937 type:complete len:226 (-) Transcript_42042:47-724(-)